MIAVLIAGIGLFALFRLIERDLDRALDEAFNGERRDR